MKCIYPPFFTAHSWLACQYNANKKCQFFSLQVTFSYCHPKTSLTKCTYKKKRNFVLTNREHSRLKVWGALTSLLIACFSTKKISLLKTLFNIFWHKKSEHFDCVSEGSSNFLNQINTQRPSIFIEESLL